MLDRPSEFEEGKRDYMLIGTGFLISRYGIFLTASHVFEAKDDPTDPRSKSALEYQSGKGLVALIVTGDTGFSCAITDIALHPTADIALGRIIPPNNNTETPRFAISTCAISKVKAKKK